MNHEHVWVEPRRIDSFSEWMIGRCQICNLTHKVVLAEDRKLVAFPQDTFQGTPRQQKIEATRVQDISQAEREAYFIAAIWGDDKTYKAALPARKWTHGPSGWFSDDRAKLRRAELA